MSEKKEYIERGALMKRLNGFNDHVNGNEHFLYGIQTARDLLESTPTADVEPVVRGEWIETSGYGMFHQHILECSVCGDQIEETKRRRALKRCPNCGAHMERSGSGE